MNVLGTAEATLWLPAQYSHLAPMVDGIWDYVMWVSVLSTLGITGAMVWLCYKFPRRKGYVDNGPVHHTGLEVTWTVIPMFLVAIMFWWGLKVYIVMATPPADSYTIDVDAAKWDWTFRYPSGAESVNELHVPMGEPIRLRMTSKDVLHAFFAKELRVKMDVIPGRMSQVWFKATRPTGVGAKTAGHDPKWIFCAEYCGKDHSRMWAELYIHETREEYEEWLDSYGPDEVNWPTWKRGWWFYEKKGCKTCHNLQGKQSTGPNWDETSKLLVDDKGTRTIQGGAKAPVDHDYILESIAKPRAKIVDGFPASMPTVKFDLDEREWIADFIKRLSEPGFIESLPEQKDF